MLKNCTQLHDPFCRMVPHSKVFLSPSMLSVMLTGKSFQYRYYISFSYSERHFHFICTSLLAYMQILWQSGAADGIGLLVMRVGWLATCSGLWENLLDRSGCPWYIVHLSQCLIHQPGFNLPRQQWSLLNHFRTEQRHCSACRRKWRLTDTDLCPCGEIHTMSHIVESCPLTKLNGGLSRLHSVDEDAVSWLTSYGS